MPLFGELDETLLRAALLAGWDPEAIRATIEQRNRDKSVLKAWAESVEPPDAYRWETHVEDNWLA